MTHRPSEFSEVRYAFWSRKVPRPRSSRSVVVAHRNRAISSSIALLLRCNGFAATDAQNLAASDLMLQFWQPDSLLVDTELARRDRSWLRALEDRPAFDNSLVIALTGPFTPETPDGLRRLGFDGLCRQPCPVWMLADMLSSFFARA